MRCKKAKRLLSAKLDGMLSPRQERAVCRHLEGCAACRAQLRAYASLDAAVGALAQTPPAALPQKIADEIAGTQYEKTAAKHRRFLWGPGTVAAALVVLLLLVYGGAESGTLYPEQTADYSPVVSSTTASPNEVQSESAALQSDEAEGQPEKSGSVLPGEPSQEATESMQESTTMAAFDLDGYLAAQTCPVLVIAGKSPTDFPEWSNWQCIAADVWQIVTTPEALQPLRETPGAHWYGGQTEETALLLLCP